MIESWGIAKTMGPQAVCRVQTAFAILRPNQYKYIAGYLDFTYGKDKIAHAKGKIEDMIKKREERRRKTGASDEALDFLQKILDGK